MAQDTSLFESAFKSEQARGLQGREIGEWSQAHMANIAPIFQGALGRGATQDELAALATQYGDIGAIKGMAGNREGFASALQAATNSYGTNKSNAALATQERDRQTLLAKQKAEEEGLFGQFESQLAGQEKLGDAYKRLRTEQGLGGLENQLEGFQGEQHKIEQLLDYLPEDVHNRADGALTDSQVRRMEAVEGEALRTQLGRLGLAAKPVLEAISKKAALIGQELNFLTAEQQRELQPTLMRIERISDRFGRELTGFTEQKQNELSVLLNQLQQGAQLSAQELESIRGLAAEERQWSRSKEEAATNFENQMKLQLAGVSTVDLGDRVQFVNGQGEVIREVRKGKLPGSGSGGVGLSPSTTAILGGAQSSQAPAAQAVPEPFKIEEPRPQPNSLGHLNPFQQFMFRNFTMKPGGGDVL